MTVSEKTICDALPIAEHPADSFILYGSYARGDNDSSSDIDVLRISNQRISADRLDGHVALYTYDIKDLREMARQGSLFILHLIREAKPLHDPCRYLANLSATFQKPHSYVTHFKGIVTPASAILDIEESLFATAPRSFMNAAIFLCRTLVYAEHADGGPFSFSLRSLAANDETALMLSTLKCVAPSYSDFELIRQIVRTKTGSNGQPNVLSMDDLLRKNSGDLLFEGLLKRILNGIGCNTYLMPTTTAAT